MKVLSLKTLSLIIAGSIGAADTAHANSATASQTAAASYEACIIGLANVTKNQINEIGHLSLSSSGRADRLADIAVTSCHSEKKKLEDALASEDELDKNHERTISSLEDACKQDIKINILSTSLKDKYKKYNK